MSQVPLGLKAVEAEEEEEEAEVKGKKKDEEDEKEVREELKRKDRITAVLSSLSVHVNVLSDRENVRIGVVADRSVSPHIVTHIQ
ncbi:hypothetical protein SprV_0602142400 [Sparganum proliferum]